MDTRLELASARERARVARLVADTAWRALQDCGVEPVTPEQLARLQEEVTYIGMEMWRMWDEAGEVTGIEEAELWHRQSVVQMEQSECGSSSITARWKHVGGRRQRSERLWRKRPRGTASKPQRDMTRPRYGRLRRGPINCVADLFKED
jgi:hypothetical protein